MLIIIFSTFRPSPQDAFKCPICHTYGIPTQICHIWGAGAWLPRVRTTWGSNPGIRPPCSASTPDLIKFIHTNISAANPSFIQFTEEEQREEETWYTNVCYTRGSTTNGEHRPNTRNCAKTASEPGPSYSIVGPTRGNIDPSSGHYHNQCTACAHPTYRAGQLRSRSSQSRTGTWET